MGDSSAPLNIDELSPKQRTKEFKVTVKEIRANDVSKRMVALEKYRREPRYLLEGESLAPLIESLAPKKKTLEYLRPGLETLVDFLQTDGQSFCLDSCGLLSRTSGSFNVLGVIADVAVYQEEVKKPKKAKKPKKGEEVPPPPVVKENETVVRNRYLSCQVLSLFAKALFCNEGVESFVAMFVTIPDILQKLCKVLQILEKSLTAASADEESDSTSTIQALLFVFDALLMVLRNGADSTASFLAIENIVPTVSSLLHVPELTLKSLQVFRFLSSQENGLATASQAPFIASMVEIIGQSADRVALDSSDAPVKKDAKKGGAEEGLNPAALTRELSVIAVVVDILTDISQKAQHCVNVSDARAIIKTLSPVALSKSVWTLCNVKPAERADPCIANLVRNICILFGCYALVEEDIRACAVEGGAIRVLLDVLTSSLQVVENDCEDLEQVSQEALARLHDLRHVLEKAILHVATKKVSPCTVGEGEVENASGEHAVRWNSCADFETDCDALRSSLNATGEDLTVSNLRVLIDLLVNIDDDMANRSSRVLSILLMGTPDNNPVALLRDMELDDIATTQLSTALFEKATALTAEIEATCVTSNMSDLHIVNDTGGDIVMENVEEKEGAEQEKVEGGGSCEPAVEEVVEGPVTVAAGKTQGAEKAAEKVKIQKLQLQEVLCNYVCCLEYLLNQDATYVATFCSEELVEILSTLLNRCGPTCNNQAAAVPEVIVRVNDPRRFDWNTEEIEHPGDEFILRELIFDLLTIVGSSDAKYRDFGEASLPQQPCTPFPESTCACASEAMLVFSIASNACLVTLLCACDFVVRDSVVTTTPCCSSILSQPVMEAALRLLHAIAGSGMPGIKGLYNAIATKGFDANADQSFSPLAYFQSFLAASVESEEKSNVDEETQLFAWEFPTLFQLQPNDENGTIVTHTSEVLSRKQAWPFLVTAGAILGIVANPRTKASTAALAINAASSLSLITNIALDIQPAAVDMFSGSLLGLGGAVALSGCLGLFGPLSNDEDGISWLTYLVQRGFSREGHWDALAEKRKQLAAEQMEEEAKANTGKKGAKKDDSKGKGKVPVPPPSEFPFEPDDSHPDPNHGPTALMWTSLLNVGTADLHASLEASQPLIAAIQGGLSTVAQDMITAGAAVNATDFYGLAPLNHSVVLGYSEVSAALILAGSDVNHLDDANNALMKYAFFAMTSSAELIDIYKHCRAEACKQDKDGLSLWGSDFFVQEIIEANADMNVSDAEKGNFLLHNAIGMGSLGYMLGGVLLTIKSKARHCSSEVSVSVLESMVAAGASVNAVNREGVAVMHTLSALGDLSAVQVLLKAGAHPNIVDANGYMPMHYLSASCPSGCVAVAEVLLKQGVRRPKYRLQYEDLRTGKSLEEKYAIDAERVLNEVLGETTCPHIVPLTRVSEKDLLLAKTDDGLSALLLTMCGDVIANAAHHKVLVSSPPTCIENRIELLKYLKKKVGADNFVKMLQETNKVVSAVQAFSLMNMDACNSSDDNVAEFMSSLQSEVFRATQDVVAASGVSTLALLSKAAFPAQWTPVHCAILANSKALLDALKAHDVPMTASEHSYVHFVAGLPGTSAEITQAIIGAAAASPEHVALLNSCGVLGQTPLHVAVAAQNIQFIEKMMEFDEVNVNVMHEATKRSAFFEAILSGSIPVVKAFITPKSAQTLDLSSVDCNGKTAIEYAFETRNVELIKALSHDFSAVCVEYLACVQEDGLDSLLMKLELENIHYCEQLGIRPAVVPAKEEKETPVQNEDDEELGLDRQVGSEANDSTSGGDEDVDDKVGSVDVAQSADGSEGDSTRVLTDPEAIEEAKKKLKQSNAMIAVIFELLRCADIVARDGHAHPCFHDGQLYDAFCQESAKTACEE